MTTKRRIHLSLAPEVLRALDELAAAYGMSRSGAAALVITDGLLAFVQRRRQTQEVSGTMNCMSLAELKQELTRMTEP